MEFHPTNWRKDLLAAEFDVMRQLGVEIRCGVEVGKDVTDRRPRKAVLDY